MASEGISINKTPRIPPYKRPGGRRFFNSALQHAARLNNASFEEYFGGWIVELQRDGRMLRTHGYQLSINSGVAMALCLDKVASALLLDRTGLPAVRSELVLNAVRQRWIDDRSPAEIAHSVLRDLPGPLIVKPNEGTSGVDVFRAEGERDAHGRIMELLGRHESVVVQPLLEIAAERRYIVLDGECILRFEKTPVVARGVKFFNLCLGGGVAWYEVQPADPEVEIALAAAATLDIRVGAVDVVETASGHCKILEVNSGISLEFFAQVSPAHYQAALDVFDRITRRALDTVS